MGGTVGGAPWLVAGCARSGSEWFSEVGTGGWVGHSLSEQE